MSTQSPLSLIILAAGKGTRMKSSQAKVLHEVFFSPMLHHVLEATHPLNAAKTVVVVGHQRDRVISALAGYDTETVTQEEQLGTGHAVLISEQAVSPETDTVMILCGDTPLIRPETLQEMYAAHCRKESMLTVMTTLLDNPTNYGRIVSDANDQVLGIVEEKDADSDQKSIKEINAGIYCVNRTFLFEALRQVGTDNSQGEVYLTDIVGIAVKSGKNVQKYMTDESVDVLGVNSRVELAQAHCELQRRRNVSVMLEGVSMDGPDAITISPDSIIGRDSLLMRGTRVTGKSVIGEGCTLHPGVLLHNCRLGKGVVIGAYTVLEDCTIDDDTVIAAHSGSI